MTHTDTPAEPCNATLAKRLAAACSDPRSHCALVLAVNAGLVASAATDPYSPALLLHLVLLPVNAWRLLQAMRVAGQTRHLPVSTRKADVPALRLQAAAMRCPAFDASRTIQTIRLSPRPTR